MNRILVTGASGYIGRHCLEALASYNVEVHAVTTQIPAWQPASTHHWHACNLLNSSESLRLIQSVRPTHLLHLAWIATPGVYWTSPLNETWRIASRQIAEQFVDHGGHRIVATGSCAEYDWSQGLCRETNPHPKPSSPYAQAKQRFSLDLAELAQRRGISCGWVRLFWSYGPYEDPRRFVPSIVLNLLHDRPAPCSIGTHRRDYMFVEDLAVALVKTLLSEVEGTINVASGTAPTIASIASSIAGQLGREHLLLLGAVKPAVEEHPLVVADVSRLHDEIGFRATHSLENGLAETISWWQRTFAKQETIIAGTAR